MTDERTKKYSKDTFMKDCQMSLLLVISNHKLEGSYVTSLQLELALSLPMVTGAGGMKCQAS